MFETTTYLNFVGQQYLFSLHVNKKRHHPCLSMSVNVEANLQSFQQHQTMPRAANFIADVHFTVEYFK